MLRFRRLFAAASVICCVLAPAASAAPDPTHVGLVTDLGGLNDRAFNFDAWRGIQRAQTTLGVTGSVIETARYADYERNLDASADAGNGLVFGIGFLMADAVQAQAAAHPETNFAIVDYSYANSTGGWDATSNVAGITFNEMQAGYLAGVLAGTVERTSSIRGLNRSRTVSAIGGQAIPPVAKYIAGFRNGVRHACANCRVLVSWSNDFIDQAKCRAKARAQARQGSDIIFVVAGGCGLGAMAEVRSRGIWAVGVDADQAYLGPHILTSAIKRVDVAVADMVRRNKDGQFPGGTVTSYGVAQGGVGLGRVALPARRYQFAVDAALAQLGAPRS